MVVYETFNVSTRSRNQMIDITSQVNDKLGNSDIRNGTVMVFCPHTTAGITINENADPDVTHDILMTLNELIPEGRAGYRHMEGNSDSHVKSSLVGASELVAIKDGKLQLGTWQGIYFCEFDGPRSRKVQMTVTGE